MTTEKEEHFLDGEETPVLNMFIELRLHISVMKKRIAEQNDTIARLIQQNRHQRKIMLRRMKRMRKLRKELGR